MKFTELNKKLFSLPKQPNAIPYVTSYYNLDWGFSLDHNSRKKLKKGTYHVKINSKLFNGSMSYGEILIKGRLKKEIFLSTYICHPSMANNEISGPTVTIHIAEWLKSQKNLKYSYRIVFLPETIGSIAYLSKNKKIIS
jgi:aminopeptidase-like protein